MHECRICGARAKPEETGYSGNGFPLLRCCGCGVVLAGRAPDPDELKHSYDRRFAAEGSEYRKLQAEFEQLYAGRSSLEHVRKNFHRRGLLRRLERRVRGRELAEIGGGVGSFGVIARARGWRYVDYDVSEAAVEFAKQLGLEARVFRPEEPPPLEPGSAAAVVLWEVLDHVWDVRSYLERLRAALQPGGALLLSTPNWDMPAYRARIEQAAVRSAPPVQVNFFTQQTLEGALRCAGFDPVRVAKRHLYLPHARLHSWKESVGWALRRDEPPTLWALASGA